MTSHPDDGEYVTCDSCLGTGRDALEADGYCVRCFGKGDYFVRYPDEDDYDDDQA